MKRLGHALGALFAAGALTAGLVATPLVVMAAPDTTYTPAPDATDGIIITLEEDAGKEVRSLEAQDGISLLSEAPVVSDLADAGVAVTDTLESSDDVLLQAEPADGQTDAEALAAAQQVDGVASVQYNYRYDLIDFVEDDASDTSGDAAGSADDGVQTLASAAPTNDPITQVATAPGENEKDYPNQYWLYGTGLVDAWDQVKCQGTVTVAVVDSGCDLDHPDIAANVLADLAYDADGSHMLKGSAVEDSQGHGTAVTSIVASVANNGIGLAGASYDAKVLPIKVFNDEGGGCYTDDLIRAYNKIFEYIDGGLVENLHVVNMSLGAHDASEVPAGSDIGVTGMHDTVLENLIITARNDYDIATVCAGGNGHPSGVTACTYANYPSDFDACIAVTGLTTAGKSLSYSDYNQYKDISTYGQSVWGAYPPERSNDASFPYSRFNGTSVASPIVAGTVALMFAAEPTASVDDVCEALYETATPISYDMTNAVDAQRAATTGSHGALDADAAVAYLVEHADDEPEVGTLPFEDVAEGDWFYSAVGFAYENGLMGGYRDANNNPTGIFGPNNMIYRRDLACVLYNMLGKNEVTEFKAPQSDVIQGQYYDDAINWCVENHIMNGYSGTDRFGTDDLVTREQMASIVANIAKKEGEAINPQTYLTLSDHFMTSDWAQENMMWAVDKGVLKGELQEDGSRLLQPLRNTTRAEVAAILMNGIVEGLIAR